MVVRGLGVALALMSLSGCVSLPTFGVKDRDRDGERTLYDVGAGLNGPPITMPDELAERFEAETESTGSQARQNLRREAIEVLVQRSNNKCNDYMTAVGAGRNGYGISFSVLASLLTTVGSVVSQGAAANAFSAASGFSQSTSNTITESVFGGREYGLIQASVWAGRQTREQAILERNRAGAYDTWSESSLVTHIQEFDRMCGVSYGLQRLLQAAQQPDRQS